MSISEVQRLQGLVPAARLDGAAAKSAEKRAGQPATGAPHAAPATGISVEVASGLAAGEPPVSSERVAEIRAALKDGSYPLVPAKIADAMIAARLSMGLGE